MNAVVIVGYLECLIFLATLVLGEPKNYLDAQANLWEYTQSSYSRSTSDLASEQVVLKAGQGIYAFDFGVGNNGQDQQQYLQVTVECGGTCVVTVWDCFCSGDSVVVNEMVGIAANTFRLLPGDPGACTIYQPDPIKCLNDPRFFMHQGSLTFSPSTTQILTLVPYATRYGGGTGFIWVEKACTILSTSTPCCQSTGTCNMTLAQHIKIIPRNFQNYNPVVIDHGNG